MDWKQWFKAAGVRALKTACQTAIAMIGTAVAISQVDWTMVASASVLAGILSILTSLAGIPEVDGGASVFAQHAREGEDSPDEGE